MTKLKGIGVNADANFTTVACRFSFSGGSATDFFRDNSYIGFSLRNFKGYGQHAIAFHPPEEASIEGSAQT